MDDSGWKLWIEARKTSQKMVVEWEIHSISWNSMGIFSGIYCFFFIGLASGCCSLQWNIAMKKLDHRFHSHHPSFGNQLENLTQDDPIKNHSHMWISHEPRTSIAINTGIYIYTVLESSDI